MGTLKIVKGDYEGSASAKTCEKRDGTFAYTYQETDDEHVDGKYSVMCICQYFFDTYVDYLDGRRYLGLYGLRSITGPAGVVSISDLPTFSSASIILHG